MKLARVLGTRLPVTVPAFISVLRSEQTLGDAVTYLILKAALSGILAMIVSEVARRSPGIGGLVASLPLISLMAIIWLWQETADTERIASHAEATFWYVLPVRRQGFRDS